MSSPNLYALLVGINKYEFLPAMRWLQYCHSDVNLLKSYLDEPAVQAKFGKTDIKVVKEDVKDERPDEMPTKDYVIRTFREHLGQAKPGDTALFYFSGHGARERTAVKSFAREELDGNIGGIVMHNFGDRSVSNPGQTMIADKEIRYLIKELADKGESDNPINIVVIFDCCHSGESTRSVLGDEMPSKSRQIERGPVGERPLEDFFFCDDDVIKSKLEKGTSLDEVLPQGDHIMLAACREIELAWEGAGGNGAFTRGLVDVLRKHDGDISYHELYSRVVNRMRFVKLDNDSNDYRQTPQFYLNTKRVSDRYRQFLTNKANEQPTYGAVEYNSSEDEYRLDIGALHGVPIDPATPTEVKVYPAGKPGEARAVTVKHVFPTHSTLDMGGFEPDASESWRGELQGVSLPKLRVALTGDQSGIDLCTRVFNKRNDESANPRVEIVSKDDEPDYLVHAADGRLQIMESGNKPLARVASEEYLDFQGRGMDDRAEIQYEFLTHIARWTMLRDLEHNGVFEPTEPRFNHPQYPVELRVFEYDPATKQETRVPTSGKNIVVDCTPAKKVRYIRFELVNRTPQDLFVSLVYMPHTFGFLTKGPYVLMHKAQLGLGPMKEPSMEMGEGHIQSSRLGASFPDMPEKKYLPFQTGAYIQTDNWPGIQEYLKLMVSEVPFEIESLHLEMLPAPDKKREGSRFMAVAIEVEKPVPKWELTTWSLFITNPTYNPQA